MSFEFRVVSDPGVLNSSLTAPAVVRARSLHFWVTGSISACLVPYWMRWIIENYPTIKISATVSTSASRFVALEAVDSIARTTDGFAMIDDWHPKASSGRAIHFDIESGADAFLVFPGTINSVMSLAAGLSHTPSLLALQMTRKPIVIAAAFPEINELLYMRLNDLVKRGNIVFSPLVPAKGTSSGVWSELSGVFAPLVMRELHLIEEDIYGVND